MKRALILGLLAVFACGTRTEPNAYVTAANAFTDAYAGSRLASWNVRASAVGQDCGVLLVETKIILEDSMVEGMQYGTGAYDINGGVEQFCTDRAFRGVAYRDGSGRVWTYGKVAASEVAGAPCR